eukprot:TRINITY_DN34270_c0_g1_i1.p1 TRINITY_DN34270_c0_g1~~TRINITY_DN34270_c0_g1_i1.p1  ORF type:complete len:1039 (+),score=164.20 TRINITY_DN34270_c0_g1_i1:62-3178(+)
MAKRRSAGSNGDAIAGRTKEANSPPLPAQLESDFASKTEAIRTADRPNKSTLFRQVGRAMSLVSGMSSTQGSWRPVGENVVKEDDELTRFQGEPSFQICGRQPVSGEIAFSSWTAQFVVVSSSAKSTQLFKLVTQSLWNLLAPKLLLSVVGGADSMEETEAFDVQSFSRGICHAAVHTRAWVITGGTSSGIMEAVGKGMKEHDRHRLVPCIGILPLGGLTDDWERLLHGATDGDQLDAAEAASVQQGFTRPQEDHTHMLISDSSTKGFGTELDLRLRFEEHLGTDLSVPRVMILANGGKSSITCISKAAALGCPVVVCRGTGRMADVIAELEDEHQAIVLGETGAQADDTQSSERNLPLIFARHMGTEKLDEDYKRMILSITGKGRVVVYTSDTRVEDVIVRAVFGRAPCNTELATTIGCGRYGRDAKQGLMLVAEWCCWDFLDDLCRMLVEQVQPEAAIKWVFQEIVARQQSSEMTEAPVYFLKWFLQHHLTHVQRFRVNDEPQSLGEILWKATTPELQEGIVGLLLWSVQKRASTAALELLWQHVADPVHVALATASACRQVAMQTHGTVSRHDVLERMELENTADHFERLAVSMMEELCDTCKGVHYLFMKPQMWRSDAFRLGHKLGCNIFVSSRVYRVAIDRYWMTPRSADLGLGLVRLDFKYQSAWRLAPILLRAVFARGAPGSKCGVSTNATVRASSRDCELGLQQLLSVPFVKAYTHFASRFLFISIYGGSVFIGCFVGEACCVSLTVQVLLFLWGCSFASLEREQWRQHTSFADYVRDAWNIIDILHIGLLLLALFIGFVAFPLGLRTPALNRFLECVHAVNLLPSFVRVLQCFLLSEYFGTLVITIFHMCKDALSFFVILSIFCLGFSLALTPILFENLDERWRHGILWTFWAIVGEKNEAAFAAIESQNILARCIAQTLLFALAIIANVLLVNLLVAVMNNTCEKFKAASETQWVSYFVSAVLEFDLAADVPPPFHLLSSLSFSQSRWHSRQGSKERPSVMQRQRRAVEINRVEIKEAQRRVIASLRQ